MCLRLLRGVEKGGHYVVLVEIEGIGRKEKRHKWKISFSTGWFLVRYSNFPVNAPLGSPLNNNTQAVKCTHTFRDTLKVHSDPVFVCEMICSLYCIFYHEWPLIACLNTVSVLLQLELTLPWPLLGPVCCCRVRVTGENQWCPLSAHRHTLTEKPARTHLLPWSSSWCQGDMKSALILWRTSRSWCVLTGFWSRTAWHSAQQ